MANGLGDILVRQGTLTVEQLQEAEEHAARNGGNVARALIELRHATESDLLRALADRLGMAFVDVSAETVDPMAAAMLPRELADELLALPVAFGERDELVVAVADPNAAGVADRITEVTGLAVRLALSARRPLLEAIRHSAGDSPGGSSGADGAATSRITGGRGDAPDGVRRPAGGPVTVESEERPSVDLDELLVALVESGGSDLHLTAGVPPTIRVHGDLRPLEGFPVLVADELRKMLYAIMTQKHREQFENSLELDMSYTVAGHSRFRVNMFLQRDSMGAVLRVIPFEIKPLDELGIPAQVANLAYLPRGFVLVTGPTGSGKSTTLASMIDEINAKRPVHIMTVEDPIEFLHNHKRSVVNQREVGADTQSFTAALKHVLRQDPDVILVGELRDLETIQIALTAAETGHLVFATLHTQDAPQTIDRVIDVFPPHQQEQIRVQLAGAIQGVVCQTLLKTVDGNGRTVATEIMTATPGVRNLIREGKTHQIYSAIQAGAQHGMVAMDQSLATLVKRGEVTYEEALEKCNSVAEFNRLAGRG